MNIKKINLATFEEFREVIEKELVFIKPFPGKLVRLYNIPERYRINTEFIQVLNTMCLRQHKGVYYFNLHDQEDEMVMVETLAAMDIFSWFVRTDVPEILN